MYDNKTHNVSYYYITRLGSPHPPNSSNDIFLLLSSNKYFLPMRETRSIRKKKVHEISMDINWMGRGISVDQKGQIYSSPEIASNDDTTAIVDTGIYVNIDLHSTLGY